MLDRSNFTLVDFKIDRDTIAGQLANVGDHVRAVSTLGDILPAQLLGHTLEHCLAKYLAFGQPGAAQRFE